MTTPKTDALKKLIRGYVNLLESGRDQIIACGGQCDPVDVMERNDPYLREAREALAALQEQARDQQGPIKTWEQRLEETCPALGPMHIHASVEEVNDVMQAEIAELRTALQEQTREGEAVVPSAILARGRFHFFKGEDGEPDDWEWFEEGTNCEHGCIDAVIVRADALSAPQPAQPTLKWCDQCGEGVTDFCRGKGGKCAYGFKPAGQPAQPVEARQPKFFVGTDMQDGVLTVSVLQREPDGVAVLVHHEEITVSAQPVAQPLPLTDEDCTRIYNEANGITTKNPPLSTARIFAAMKAAHGIGGAL